MTAALNNVNAGRRVHHVICLVLGITMLLAWNTWITCVALFRAKLAGTGLETTFEAWLSFVFSTANLATLTLLMLARIPLGSVRLPLARSLASLSSSVKVTAGLVTNACVFIAMVVLSKTPLDASLFFSLALGLVGLSAIAGALMASVMAIVSELHPFYAQCVSMGQGIAGLVPSVVALFAPSGSHASSPSMTPFYVSIAFSLLSLVGLNALPATPSECGFAEVSLKRMEEDEEIMDPDDTTHDESACLKRVLWKTREFSAAMLIDFTLTLAVFPPLTVSVLPVSPHWDKSVFTAVMFIVFNVGDLVGKFLPAVPICLIQSPQSLLTASIARILFIPLLLACNVPQPAMIPTLFGDAAFMSFVLALGVTNGWIESDAFVVGPARVAGVKGGEGLAADVLVYCLTAGCAIGGAASLMFV